MNEDRMQIAKGRLGLYAGFWLALASKMQWTAGNAPGGVAATNGQMVIYNRDNMNKRTLGECVFIALHEVVHPMLCHLVRRGERDPQIYGIAIDIIDNKFVKRIMDETPILRMEVPADAIFGAQFGMTDDEITTVEDVYDWLMKNAKGKKKGKGKGKGGQGESEDSDSLPSFDDHMDPTNEDGSAMTPTQKEALEKEWQIAVQSAAKLAKDMGKLPGFMEEFINELLQSKVDWRSQLWAATKVAKEESSYRRFNRRYVYSGTYLPGKYSERIGALGYTADTSGSISTEEFKQALTEMNTIIEELKPDLIYFGQCDTRLVSVEELTVDSLPLAVTVKGRGGTDMKEAFAWACEHEDELDMFVLQTDGYVPALDPALHPKCPVIIIVTTDAQLPAGWEFDKIIRVEV
jgi:predicted metal-dependent peptidase